MSKPYFSAARSPAIASTESDCDASNAAFALLETETCLIPGQ